MTGYWVESSPAIGADGSIYVGSDDNNIYALTSSGTLLWKYLTGSMVLSSPAIGADGSIYVGSYDNNIYAFASSSGGPLSHLPEGSLNNASDINSNLNVLLVAYVIASICVIAVLFMTYRVYQNFSKTKETEDLDFENFHRSGTTEDKFDLNNPMHEEK